MKTCFIGVDPGLSGGVAWMVPGSPATSAPMPPTDGDLRNLLFGILATPECRFTAALEDIPRFTGAAIPGSRLAPLFHNAGFVKGFLMGRGIQIVMVKPQDWQKTFGVGTARACRSKTEWKNKLKGRAQELFPGIKVTLKTADALLILEHVSRQVSDTYSKP